MPVFAFAVGEGAFYYEWDFLGFEFVEGYNEIIHDVGCDFDIRFGAAIKLFDAET